MRGIASHTPAFLYSHPSIPQSQSLCHIRTSSSVGFALTGGLSSHLSVSSFSVLFVEKVGGEGGAWPYAQLLPIIFLHCFIEVRGEAAGEAGGGGCGFLLLGRGGWWGMP
jgi:hypothetical protein